MTIIEHLLELRTRILRCFLYVLLLFFMLFYFANDLYTIVSQPLRMYLPAQASMIATGVISPFLTPFKLTIVLCVYLVMPLILFEIWGFVAPALYKDEKLLVLPLVIVSTLLFYIGILFAYFVVLPIVFNFVTATVPEGAIFAPDIAQYLDFILTFFFAFGVSFQIPILTVLLVKMGLVSVNTLKRSRAYVIVACFIIGMLITPPDVISQSLIAIPMCLLFEIGLFCSSIMSAARINPKEIVNK